MGAVGTLFNIVSTTSQAVAEVEWKLWRKAKSGKPEDRKEVTSHAALDVWNKPNSFFTRQELVESVQQHIDLTGEGWCVVGRNPKARTIPLELWPVRPDRMTPVASPTEFLTGYIYTSPDGEQVPLERDSVLMLRMPNPEDPYRGMGPVQAILTDIDSAKYSAEWNRNFFLNSAEPGGIIEVPTRLGDGEWKEMVTRWREQHQGVANAHRVAVIEQGKWVNRTFSMRDMQFVELRNVSKEIIREAFGFPKFASGEVDDVNRATAEASANWFAARLTVPRLKRWKGLLNNDLLPLFGGAGQGLEFDYESPVTEDEEAENAERTSKATAAKTYIDAGFTGDSVKDALELPDQLEYEKPEPPPPPVAPPVPGAEPPPAPGEKPDMMPTDQVAALLTRVLEARLRDDDRPDDRPFRRQYWT
jgi:HK97 family phage portal protein